MPFDDEGALTGHDGYEAAAHSLLERARRVMSIMSPDSKASATPSPGHGRGCLSDDESAGGRHEAAAAVPPPAPQYRHQHPPPVFTSPPPQARTPTLTDRQRSATKAGTPPPPAAAAPSPMHSAAFFAAAASSPPPAPAPAYTKQPQPDASLGSSLPGLFDAFDRWASLREEPLDAGRGGVLMNDPHVVGLPETEADEGEEVEYQHHRHQHPQEAATTTPSPSPSPSPSLFKKSPRRHGTAAFGTPTSPDTREAPRQAGTAHPSTSSYAGRGGGGGGGGAAAVAAAATDADADADSLYDQLKAQQRELELLEQEHLDYQQRTQRRGARGVGAPPPPPPPRREAVAEGEAEEDDDDGWGGGGGGGDGPLRLDELLARRKTAVVAAAPSPSPSPSPLRAPRETTSSKLRKERAAAAAGGGGGGATTPTRGWDTQPRQQAQALSMPRVPSSRGSSPASVARTASPRRRAAATTSPAARTPGARTPSAKRRGSTKGLVLGDLSTNMSSVGTSPAQREKRTNYARMKAAQSYQAQHLKQQQQQQHGVPAQPAPQKQQPQLQLHQAVPMPTVHSADFEDALRAAAAQHKQESAALSKQMIATADKLHTQRTKLKQLQVCLSM